LLTEKIDVRLSQRKNFNSFIENMPKDKKDKKLGRSQAICNDGTPAEMVLHNDGTHAICSDGTHAICSGGTAATCLQCAIWTFCRTAFWEANIKSWILLRIISSFSTVCSVPLPPPPSTRISGAERGRRRREKEARSRLHVVVTLVCYPFLLCWIAHTLTSAARLQKKATAVIQGTWQLSNSTDWHIRIYSGNAHIQIYCGKRTVREHKLTQKLKVFFPLSPFFSHAIEEALRKDRWCSAEKGKINEKWGGRAAAEGLKNSGSPLPLELIINAAQWEKWKYRTAYFRIIDKSERGQNWKFHEK